MAERTRFEAAGEGRLSAALEREARAERPAFSSALQERVLLTLAAQRGRRAPDAAPAPVGVPAGREAVRPIAWIGAAGGLVAAACVAIAVMAPGPRPAPTAPAAAVAGPGIEALPTPEEIGGTVLAEVATLAAAAAGVPDLADLAAFDPAALLAADEPRP